VVRDYRRSAALRGISATSLRLVSPLTRSASTSQGYLVTDASDQTHFAVTYSDNELRAYGKLIAKRRARSRWPNVFRDADGRHSRHRPRRARGVQVELDRSRGCAARAGRGVRHVHRRVSKLLVAAAPVLPHIAAPGGPPRTVELLVWRERHSLQEQNDRGAARLARWAVSWISAPSCSSFAPITRVSFPRACSPIAPRARPSSPRRPRASRRQPRTASEPQSCADRGQRFPLA
jgi:hypothetical protein